MSLSLLLFLLILHPPPPSTTVRCDPCLPSQHSVIRSGLWTLYLCQFPIPIIFKSSQLHQSIFSVVFLFSLGTYPVSPYLFLLSTFIFPLWDHIFSLQSSFRILSSSLSLSYDTSVATFNLQYVPVSLKPYGSCLRLLHRPHVPPFFP
jgi:hypothetical protein